MHFHFYEFHRGVTTKASPLNTNELRSKKKNHSSEKSLDSEKSLPITNSLLYSDQLISRDHFKFKITFNHYITI